MPAPASDLAQRSEIPQRVFEPLLEPDPRLPAEVPQAGDVRLPPLRIVFGQIAVHDRRTATREPLHRLGQFQDRCRMRAAEGVGLAFALLEHLEDARAQVADMAEAARLATVTVDGKG